MGLVEVAVVGLIGFVGLLVLVAILLMDRVLKIEKLVMLGVRTGNEHNDRLLNLEYPGTAVDPVVEPARCGPACRTETSLEANPWCATHRRWWAPEGPS